MDRKGLFIEKLGGKYERNFYIVVEEALHKGVSVHLVVLVNRIEVHFGRTFGSPERPPKNIFYLNDCKGLHFVAENFPT